MWWAINSRASSAWKPLSDSAWFLSYHPGRAGLSDRDYIVARHVSHLCTLGGHSRQRWHNDGSSGPIHKCYQVVGLADRRGCFMGTWTYRRQLQSLLYNHPIHRFTSLRSSLGFYIAGSGWEGQSGSSIDFTCRGQGSVWTIIKRRSLRGKPMGDAENPRLTRMKFIQCAMWFSVRSQVVLWTIVSWVVG